MKADDKHVSQFCHTRQATKMTAIGSRDFVTQFIAKLKELPCLWQVTDKEYHNKNKRESALDELLEFYKTKHEDANKDMIKKKIQSLRSSFRKEHNKIKASMRSGAGTEDIHVPKLWYYDQLTFLADVETPRPSSSLTNILSNSLEETDEFDFYEDTNDAMPTLQPVGSTPPVTQSLATHGSTGLKRTKNQADIVLSKISKKLDDPAPPTIQRQKYDAFGEHVAEKLRSLPMNVAIHCHKLINDAIYMGELNNLNVTSHIITNPINIVRLDQNQNVEPSNAKSDDTQILYEAYRRAFGEDN